MYTGCGWQDHLDFTMARNVLWNRGLNIVNAVASKDLKRTPILRHVSAVATCATATPIIRENVTAGNP